jgi:hypothetical protein
LQQCVLISGRIGGLGEGGYGADDNELRECGEAGEEREYHGECAGAVAGYECGVSSAALKLQTSNTPKSKEAR